MRERTAVGLWRAVVDIPASRVTATSPTEPTASRRGHPGALINIRFWITDNSDVYPDATELGVALASLSLHYFAWKETVSIVDRVRLAPRLGGVPLCRLNSTEDRNFGAYGCEEIEPNYFLVNGQPKRFFDESAVRRLFADGWNTIALEHITTGKYHQPKAAWEVILERVR